MKGRKSGIRTIDLRTGLSLLEVIIATVVLAVSSVMLVRIIGNADRHATKADRRITAQMICQNKLDEILAGLELLESSGPKSDLYFPDWQYSVQVTEWVPEQTVSLERNVLVQVEAFYNPVSDLQNALPSQKQDPGNDRPVYILKRLIRRPLEFAEQESGLELVGSQEAGEQR